MKQKLIKRSVATLLVLVSALGILSFSSCKTEKIDCGEDGVLDIVTTIFPQYDFVREIAGDVPCNITMLITPGAESHTFMPTVEDMVLIEQCDLFICAGGEIDSWVDSEILPAIDMSEKKILYLTDMVELICSDSQHHEHEHEEGEDYDAHVWTSPVNARRIAEELCTAMCELDPDNAESYKANKEAFCGELTKLDNDFAALAKNERKKTIVVGDRFPFLYLAEEYGFSYVAAFEGCSSSSEPTLSVINELVTTVKENESSVVFCIEFSNGKTADAICAATGAERRLLHSCHNVTREEFEAGEGYISLMRKNLENLEEALNG